MMLIELAVGAILALALILLVRTQFESRRSLSLLVETEQNLSRIGQAMDAYLVDNGGYPASEGDSPLDRRATLVQTDQRLLTTPLAYLNNVPTDPYRRGLPRPGFWIYGIGYTGQGFASYSLYPRTAWMSWSIGPDRSGQTGGYLTLRSIPENEGAGIHFRSTHGMRYDPTNGILSDGDLYIFGGEALTR